MARIRLSHTLIYPAPALFDLVADIERYPAFLPYFVDAQVLRRTPHAIRVTQTVCIFGLRFSFPSLAIMDRPNRLTVYSRNRPFRHIRARWDFQPLSEGCVVELRVDYDLYARWLERMLQPAVRFVAARMVTAFCERADQLLDHCTRTPS